MKAERRDPKRLFSLSLGALGVVFGDIGTSPLYSLKITLLHVSLSQDNIFGVLSLIFWGLIIVISIKYLVFILRADNDGEGGTIALLSLLKPQKYGRKTYATFFLLGLFGTSLLFGDGMITPAISVLSAVEGLAIVSPFLHDLIIPITLGILLVLFLLQSKGTEKLGTLFGIVMSVWFLTIGVLGIVSIAHYPQVLLAINPLYAVHFIETEKTHSLLVLTGVFLAMTGGEALYADISHFGKNPIRISWFFFVLPALLLNYFGQAADLSLHPEHLSNPFYFLAPSWFLSPLLIIATLAAVLASQAVISAVFSLAKQAIALQFLPRLSVIFTSPDIKSQVYVPAINLITAVGTLGLVISFQSSDNLASAYGLAVNMDMFIVTILVILIAYKQWLWSLPKVLLFTAVFLSIDLAFLAGNSLKFFHKGWFPVVFGILGTLTMITWRQGLKLLRVASTRRKIAFQDILEKVNSGEIVKIPGVAVFISEPYDESRNCLYRQLAFNKTIHEVTLLVSVVIEDKPIVDLNNRIKIYKQNGGIHYLELHYGFMQSVDIPNTLRVCQELKILTCLANQQKFVYFLEMVKGQISEEYNQNISYWQKKWFLTLLNFSTQKINFYNLPYDQTIMIGTYYEI